MTNLEGNQLVMQAISFAARSHQGQSRKDQVTPYVAHPMRVLFVLANIFNVRDPEVLAAAVLHDTIEDTTTDFDELAKHFGERVARYVALLSKDSRLPEHDRERSYLAALAQAPVEVKLCKLGDAYDNLLDAEGLSQEARDRAVDKARQVMQQVGESLPQSWQHVLPLVQQRIDAAATVR